MTTLSDQIIFGKPILLTAVSQNAAEMMAKEEAWKKGKEPRILDIEILDDSILNSFWSSYNPGDFIIVTGACMADSVVQEAIGQIMWDPDKMVVIADTSIPDNLPAEKFAHWVKL